MKEGKEEMKRTVIIQGPKIGTKAWVCLGRTTADTNCVVGSPTDLPRSCTILGYIVEVGLAAGVQPRSENTVNHLVKVRLATPIYLGARQGYGEKQKDWIVHISCLKSLAKSSLRLSGDYGFLYGIGETYVEGEERCRNIKAKSLRGACGKMLKVLRRMSERHGEVWLDQDVSHKGKDLSLHEIDHPIREYL